MELEVFFNVCICLLMVFICLVDNKYKEECMKGNIGIVFFEKINRNFKNIDCLFCNGELLDGVKCGLLDKGEIFNLKLFEIVMEFLLEEIFKFLLNLFFIFCFEIKVFDLYLEICEDGFVWNFFLVVCDMYCIK